jgi:hypothetical protein
VDASGTADIGSGRHLFVGMTLYDEVGSILTGAGIEIETIESEFAESPAADRIKKVKERLNEVMKESGIKIAHFPQWVVWSTK